MSWPGAEASIIARVITVFGDRFLNALVSAGSRLGSTPAPNLRPVHVRPWHWDR